MANAAPVFLPSGTLPPKAVSNLPSKRPRPEGTGNHAEELDV
jgi:hypothetical protein